MKKRRLFFSIFILGMILFNLSVAIVIASDDDFDGVDDEYEILNNRNIAITFSSDEFEVESFLRSGMHRDTIRFDIRYDNDGIEIELQYNPDTEGSNIELDFSVSFQKLIEFVDMDSNGIYDNSTDQTIQEVEIQEFSKINYSQFVISPNTTLHYIKLETKDGIFKTHFFFSEEFTTVNNSLITPTQSKIDIEIDNFNYTHGSSQLALYVKLESESDYEEKEETEDESLGFAFNETSVFTSNESRIGFLSWRNSAIVDGNESQISISSIQVDDDDDFEQKLYINYPRGQNIYHDPKLGVEGILQSIFQPPFPFGMTIIVAISLVLSISIGYAVYHYRETLIHSIFLANEKKKQVAKIKGKNLSYSDEKIEQMLDNPQLTSVSPDFFQKVDLLELDSKEKDEFIKEMLALNPFERKLIIKEMIKKSKFRK
ncbi:MAG: hypothetical protein ACFE9S_13570 [Candidatus Hermodarchaeota archaeon]